MAESVVSVNLLTYYKDLYSGHKILYVRFLGEEFIFRTITRKEYKYIVHNCRSRMEIEDAICNTTCIYPEDYEFEYCGFAGLNEYVAKLLEELSGFSNIYTVLDEYKQYRQVVTLELQCMDLIKAFIPEYTYEEMEDWTWEKLMKMTVRAERLAELKGFDWHLQDESQEYMQEMSKISSDNKEFIDELYYKGIDPMFYFENEIKQLMVHDIVDFPLISSGRWNDEVVLDVIRKQQQSNGRRP